jgi:SAM-dependent methyltransferase
MFEFVFFFTHYWWWKLQWLFIRNYWKFSGYTVYQEEKYYARELHEDNFAFGETGALTTKLMLQEIKPRKGSLVYDLGSGRGTFLFSAYFLFDIRGVGIELLPTYMDKCKTIQKILKIGGIMFKQGNIADIDLSDADIVYLSGSNFQDDIVDKVKENLKSIKPGSIVIIIRRKLPDEHFTLLKEDDFPFSWGTEHVYFYKKI